MLRERGVHIVEPESGRLAGGDVGAGRLADPATIVAAVERVLGPGDLDGMSRGRVGRRHPRADRRRPRDRQPQLAASRATPSPPRPRRAGPRVTLVSTVDLPVPAGVRGRAPSRRPTQMQRAMTRSRDDHDVIVMSAAVADFRPKARRRRQAQEARRRPRDRARADARHPRRVWARPSVPGQVLVGFAAETDDLSPTPPQKLRREAPRSHRRQRRECTPGWLRSRHKCGYAVAARRGACRDRPRIEARCRSGRHRHHHRHHRLHPLRPHRQDPA